MSCLLRARSSNSECPQEGTADRPGLRYCFLFPLARPVVEIHNAGVEPSSHAVCRRRVGQCSFSGRALAQRIGRPNRESDRPVGPGSVAALGEHQQSADRASAARSSG